MTEVVISTNYERKISVENEDTRGVILTATDTESCKSVNTYLTKREIRLLVDALEPYAEKTKTSLELFEAMPLGTKFYAAGDNVGRVKITEDEYVLLGDKLVLRKERLSANTIVEGN